MKGMEALTSLPRLPAASDDGVLMGLTAGPWGTHTPDSADTLGAQHLRRQLHFGLNCGAVLRSFCNCGGDGWGGRTERQGREVAKSHSQSQEKGWGTLQLCS